MPYVVAEYQITQVAAPAAEPLSLADAKLHLRVEHSDDDTLIGMLIKSAREYAEYYTGLALVSRSYRADLPAFYDSIRLPGPVASITHVKYYDTASPSVLQTVATTHYALADNVLYRQHGYSWPDVNIRHDAVQVTYIAGYPSTSSPLDQDENVPSGIKVAMLLMIGDWYENREAQIVGTIVAENMVVKALLNSYREYR